MKRASFILLIFVVLFTFCSEKKSVLEVTTHPKAWNEPGSKEFHGKKVLEIGTETCKSCHGKNFEGGKSGVACSDCHASYPHPAQYSDPQSENFHGVYLKAQEFDLQECQSCHGEDFAGGDVGVACATCHAAYPHPSGFITVESPEFHGAFIKNQQGWRLEPCQACHGTDYSGGRIEVSCRTCHTSPAGPEACNTCHGSEENFAPPEDLDHNTSPTAIGVGAHQIHVAETDKTNPYTNCSVCHIPVLDYSDPHHIDDTPFAEVVFDTLASNHGKLNPIWNRNSVTCSSVYCHGHFEFKKSESANTWAYVDSVIVGLQTTPIWTEVDHEGEECEMCHSLPPTGHINADYDKTSCATCHTRVVDNTGTIIDKSLHINGKADVF